jgi:hypothetical protein
VIHRQSNYAIDNQAALLLVFTPTASPAGTQQNDRTKDVKPPKSVEL